MGTFNQVWFKQIYFCEFYSRMVKELCENSGVTYIGLNAIEIATYHKLPSVPNHKDPFDRMLIWQCIKNNYTLMSRDKKFEVYIEFGLKIIN